MTNYFICLRNKSGNGFGENIGSTSYLVLPDKEITKADYVYEARVKKEIFLKSINPDNASKNVVVFIHGFNNGIASVLARHNGLKAGLQKAGFDGDLISFDWPCDDSPLMYLPDRHKAKETAFRLVSDGIKLLANQYSRDCKLTVHLIAHSTGAYLIREAFDDATTTDEVADVSWTVGQLIFIAGDVSSESLAADEAKNIYSRCNRFTNYFNQYDEVLAISNAKRLGFKNRAGRVGLPGIIPNKAVDVNCSDYYKNSETNLNVVVGAKSHSWYFYSEEWYKDVNETILGNLDRNVIPTRDKKDDGFILK